MRTSGRGATGSKSDGEPDRLEPTRMGRSDGNAAYLTSRKWRSGTWREPARLKSSWKSAPDPAQTAVPGWIIDLVSRTHRFQSHGNRGPLHWVPTPIISHGIKVGY